MTSVVLPDGSKRDFDGDVNGLQLATSIGTGLAKAAVAIRINGELRDLTTRLNDGAQVAIITRDSDDALEILRHDAAHVLAEAAKELYPEIQVTIGPVIANGFYYDFARAEPFTPEDLAKLEARMREIVDRDETISREEWQREEAVAYFKSIGEHYKAEIIDSIPAGEPIGLYRQGAFLDLCRGPHLPSTGKLGKAFKLMSVAGAYWRGDSNNAMLQRVYGTCWRNDKELQAYLLQIEEAERRDHRKLGKEMDLFHFQEEAPGAVFWHPKGWRLFQQLISYMRGRQEDAGYVEISTPTVMDRSLWECSGHWENFRENMYITQTEDERIFALKPMNCPGGMLVYNHGITSYRDLPRRVAEFGKVNRYEPSGSLHGLMRVREFTQDDAHIFCTVEQMQEECRKVVALIMDIYRDFGFEEVRIKLSDRPAKRIGSDAIWDQLEAALKGALAASAQPYTLNPGEGAFYGPKLEFVLRDAIGRDWQCGTLQVDMNLPERFNATYVGEDGSKHRPVMLHRALFGSLERFAGILLEHHAGHLPLWLAPQQIVVATIVSDADAYAEEIVALAKARGLRAVTDLRNEKINYKVREHSHQKVPVMLVLGKREVDERSVSVRRFGEQQTRSMSLEDALSALQAEVQARGKSAQ